MMNRLFIFFALTIFLAACAPRYTINHDYPVKPISFPKDTAAHYDAQTEWWYYTGHVFDEDRNEYGFELTFFKRVTNHDKSPLLKLPAYWIKDLGMVGHFAVTDIKGQRFEYTQKINLFNQWKADPDVYDVAIGNWSAKDDEGVHRLKAEMEGYELDLELKPVKNPVLNGPGGIVAKGGGNANYYYSITRIEVSGSLKKAGIAHKVHGIAWMDHEYGTMKVSRGAKGWDWFSIQLNDGTDLMLYMIRGNNELIKESGGTFVGLDGEYRWLKLEDIEMKKTASWHSSRTDADYPAAWEIYIRPLDLKLTVKPLMADQELTLAPIDYWEGAVSVMGSREGAPVMGKGYVELVGYSKKSKLGNVPLD
jgi:predicted secreted hydrolase